MEVPPESWSHYELLGVPLEAEETTIASAYRKLARKWHPDHNPDLPEAVAVFHRIFAAYETLMDAPKRQQYDRTVREALRKQQREQESRETLQRQAAEARKRNDLRTVAIKEMKLKLYQREEEHRQREADLAQQQRRTAHHESELKRMREENEALVQRMTAQEHKRVAAAREAAAAERDAGSIQTTIRVRWDSSLYPLTADYLRSVFERSGDVVTVLMRRPGVALVVFRTIDGVYGSVAAAEVVAHIVPLTVSFMDPGTRRTMESLSPAPAADIPATP